MQVPSQLTSLANLYHQRQQSHYHTAQVYAPAAGAGTVTLWSAGKAPTSWGPATVEDYSSSRDGVWYPDSLAPILQWHGTGMSFADSSFGSGQPFDPFQLPAGTDRALLLAYTAKMACTDCGCSSCQQAGKSSKPCKLQRFMDCTSFAAVPPERGNLAIADQGGFG